MAASGHPFGALRPGQITPDRLRRPPAQPGACARPAGNVRAACEAVENRLAGKRGVPCPVLCPESNVAARYGLFKALPIPRAQPGRKWLKSRSTAFRGMAWFSRRA
ncbi:hypothetical protein L195_g060267 [Trifolium pratense]|uniref:Uncharacterized protein n=1 Tax=Trifolium pratense TaxID=57577 RepID=A0A2K3K2Y3_TRIPR|nr:hypothetical protein L195_g060267 [Trifolium pratense]